MAIRYDQGIVAWAVEQAKLLRSGALSALDLEHFAEEIEGVGKSKQRELASQMAVLLSPLLKGQVQPERQSSSRRLTINEQRKAILRCLQKTPSLKYAQQECEWWDDVWSDARLMAEKETGVLFLRFPY